MSFLQITFPKTFIYVASPYSHADREVRERRYKQVCYYVMGLLEQRKYPYSPIVANHRFAEEFNLEHDALSWMSYNFAFLSAASEMHVLMLEGWSSSVGVNAEIAYWRGAKQGLPLFFAKFDWQKITAEAGTGGLSCEPMNKDG